MLHPHLVSIYLWGKLQLSVALLWVLCQFKGAVRLKGFFEVLFCFFQRKNCLLLRCCFFFQRKNKLKRLLMVIIVYLVKWCMWHFLQPDITVLVDWASKTNYLAMYQYLSICALKHLFFNLFCFLTSYLSVTLNHLFFISYLSICDLQSPFLTSYLSICALHSLFFFFF